MLITIVTRCNKDKTKFGFGIIAFDTNGNLLVTWALVEKSSYCKEVGAIMAIRFALIKAME